MLKAYRKRQGWKQGDQQTGRTEMKVTWTGVKTKRKSFGKKFRNSILHVKFKMPIRHSVAVSSRLQGISLELREDEWATDLKL